MTAVEQPELYHPSSLSNGIAAGPWDGHALRLASLRLQSSIAVVIAHGDIDASNAHNLTEYTLAQVIQFRRLILDLRRVDFFGTEGFSALHKISVNCARLGRDWAIVPGAAVNRSLEIYDPESSLPVASTLAAALTTFAERASRRPRLVAADTRTAS
jgi:anti-anti-sigma factor